MAARRPAGLGAWASRRNLWERRGEPRELVNDAFIIPVPTAPSVFPLSMSGKAHVNELLPSSELPLVLGSGPCRCRKLLIERGCDSFSREERMLNGELRRDQLPPLLEDAPHLRFFLRRRRGEALILQPAFKRLKIVFADELTHTMILRHLCSPSHAEPRGTPRRSAAAQEKTDLRTHKVIPSAPECAGMRLS